MSEAAGNTASEYKSGFVALIGKPNVGKSTVLNYYIEEKLSIVSAKPQTTRQAIRGILTAAAYQVVFVDTPGVHQVRHRLDQQMLECISRTAADADVLAVLFDGTGGITADDRSVCEVAQRQQKRPGKILVLVNKIDAVAAVHRPALLSGVRQLLPQADCLPVSAVTGENLPTALARIVGLLPSGPQLFPEQQLTDRNERFFVQELIREQALLLCAEEVPHSVAVLVDEFRDHPGRKTLIRATIYVERDSQKGIIIGRNGQMLKNIGSAARLAIRSLIGRELFLELWVKVRRNWRKDPAFVRLVAGE